MFLPQDGWAISYAPNAIAASDPAASTSLGAGSARDARCTKARSADKHAVPSGKIDLCRAASRLDLTLIESAKTGKTENALEPGASHEMLRFDPRSTASRFAGSGENSISGGSPLIKSQTRPKPRAEKADIPIVASGQRARETGKHRPPTAAAMEGHSREIAGVQKAAVAGCAVNKTRNSRSGSNGDMVRGNRANRANPKNLDEMDIGSGWRCFSREPAQTAETCSRRRAKPPATLRKRLPERRHRPQHPRSGRLPALRHRL